MMRSLVVVVAVISAGFVAGIHRYPRLKGGPRDAGDAGEPLFLTPYIERGEVNKGKQLARVAFTEDLNITSYAGYFTVNKTYDSNQFFWYFPPINATPDVPVLVWLQGGPGATSLYGLFNENGPILVHNEKFKYRNYNWALNHHLIYIDSPVGTGFSFTKNPNGYCVDEVQVGEQLYSSISQFLKLFPELQRNRFYISGESYGGKYIPALAYTIHKRNPAAEVKINLKGMAIGNGLTDPQHQLLYSKYLYQIGLIDWHQAKLFEEYETRAVEFIKQENWEEACHVFGTLMNLDIINGSSVIYNTTGFEFYFNYLHTKDYTHSEDFSPMLEKSFVRRGINVGEMQFHGNVEVAKALKVDFMQSVAPWVSELLDHYKVLIYSGQLDIIVAYPLTVNYLRNLNFTGADEYRTAQRRIWRVDGEVAGYVKEAGRLVEVLVRNAGHMVPGDQPKWAFDLITSLTHEKPLIPEINEG